VRALALSVAIRASGESHAQKCPCFAEATSEVGLAAAVGRAGAVAQKHREDGHTRRADAIAGAEKLRELEQQVRVGAHRGAWPSNRPSANRAVPGLQESLEARGDRCARALRNEHLGSRREQLGACWVRSFGERSIKGAPSHPRRQQCTAAWARVERSASWRGPIRVLVLGTGGG
jgi:hypothetical protein